MTMLCCTDIPTISTTFKTKVSFDKLSGSRLHATPFHAKRSHPFGHPALTVPLTFCRLFRSAKQPAFLDTGPESPATHQMQQVDLFVPSSRHGEKMAVKPEWVAGVDEELTAKAEAGGHEIILGMEMLEECVRGG